MLQPFFIALMILKTAAKLNLSLLVDQPMENGYHPIFSIFDTINLQDELRIGKVKEKGCIISSDHPDLPTGEGNIIKKIYQSSKLTFKSGLSIKIKKNIPMGGGLGGGSSNAAGFLWGCNQLMDWGYSIEELMKIGLTFGADVPFFLRGGTAFVTGVGEKIHSIEQRQKWYLLIIPDQSCHTGQVYQAFDQQSPVKITEKMKSQIQEEYFGPNMLMPSVLDQYPVCQKLVNKIKNFTDKNLYMSGSGATFFMAFDNKNEAELKEIELKKTVPHCHFFVVKSIKQAIQEARYE